MSKYQSAIVDYFAENPSASLGQVAKALGCSKSTVNKYKPTELKAKPLSEEEAEALYARLERQERLLEKLNWSQIKEIRNANNYRLFPVNWDCVESYFARRNKPIPANVKSADEFEFLLKEVCDSLYGWNLYEPCPICENGILVPRWRAGTKQWTPFCGCSNFPECRFAIDRAGELLE